MTTSNEGLRHKHCPPFGHAFGTLPFAHPALGLRRRNIVFFVATPLRCFCIAFVAAPRIRRFGAAIAPAPGFSTGWYAGDERGTFPWRGTDAYCIPRTLHRVGYTTDYRWIFDGYVGDYRPDAPPDILFCNPAVRDNWWGDPWNQYHIGYAYIANHNGLKGSSSHSWLGNLPKPTSVTADPATPVIGDFYENWGTAVSTFHKNADGSPAGGNWAAVDCSAAWFRWEAMESFYQFSYHSGSPLFYWGVRD